MTLCNAAAIVFCIVVNCVHIESQVSFPLPTLSLQPSVNTSDIQLLSEVKLYCTIPDKAPYPVSVFIAHADNPVENPASWANFENLRVADTIIFTILMNADTEGSFVCWYKSTRTGQASGLSNAVNLVINSLPNPIMSLHPSMIRLGKSYIIQCVTPANGFMNVTLRLYERLLPLSPGKENFTHMGSRVLTPGEWGGSINQTNAVVSAEYVCRMEVFYKGRVLQSISSPVVAIPDELPAGLYLPIRDSAACSGYLSLKVQKVWRPMCFPYANEEDVANIVCREVNCGNALTWDKLKDTSLIFLGRPKCTGKEKTIAECPVDNQNNCEQQTLHVICSGAMPPPKLSVIGHGSASWVYIRSKESATLTCTLESSSLVHNDWIYLTVTHNGQEITNRYTRSDVSIEYVMSSTVIEGEYACFAHPSSSSVKKSENSNSVHIYIYDPPPAGAVAAAVVTTVVGAAFLIYVCVFRKSQEDEPSPVAISPDPEVAQPVNSASPPQEAPESTHRGLPQV
ncbi:uncharacterized protein [Salminus brasiliensis]|uniref:uncharacterized protein n=1 Tax=Salminus brasiliensis TaxID=930266 RepID=UPI003B82C7DC